MESVSWLVVPGSAFLLLLTALFAGSVSRARLPRATRRARGRRKQEADMGANFPVGDAPHDAASGARRADACFVPPGRSVTVQGVTLPGGMLYVGSDLVAVAGAGEPEPALIDPARKADLRRPAAAGGDLHYWPSYATIPPAARGAYLRWLEGGRRDPSVPIGFVFLFFYGLERRLLADLPHVARARAEAEAIAAEIERLLETHGDQPSFRRYASQLLAYAHVVLLGRDPAALRPRVAAGGRDPGGLPFDLRLALGALVARDRPIPPEWAFAWLLAHPATALRTPARRCPDEFRALFLARYGRRFGAGMHLSRPRARLEGFTPASPSFGPGFAPPLPDLPDVAALTRPVTALHELAASCQDDLDAYSRLVGRGAVARDSIAALAHLPAELSSGRPSQVAERLLRFAAAAVDAATDGIVGGDELFLQLEPGAGKRLGRREAVELAQALETQGFGLEPDVRFGGAPPRRDRPAVLFRLPAASPAAPSEEYRAASLFLQLAAGVAAADGTVDSDEQERLERSLAEAFHLGAAEVVRLRAHLRWQLAAAPGFEGLKRRVADLSEETRHALARFAVGVAGADGRIVPDEVEALRRVYALLDLAPDDVYADVHALAGAPAAEPFRERPPAAERTSAPLTIDPRRVAATLRDTAAVSRLLAEVFRDADAPESAESAAPAEPTVERGPPTGAPAGPIGGLDARHSAVLHDLAAPAAPATWERAEFEELARRHGLLPDGALETLNEAAFEAAGAALLAGEDPLELDQEVLREMVRDVEQGS